MILETIRNTEGLTNRNTGGLINKAAILGTYDPLKYMRRYKLEQVKRGGYEIQMSPHDIASLVNHARPYMKGKRMLCVGAETFGAERFIAEELGMIEVDLLYGVTPLNASNVNGAKDFGITVNEVDVPEREYDLITIFGEHDFNMQEILRYSKVNGLVACLNINTRAEMPGLRLAWFRLRQRHFAILQTTVNVLDMGVGMVKIEGKDDYAVQVEETESVPLFTTPGHSPRVPSGNTRKCETPAIRQIDIKEVCKEPEVDQIKGKIPVEKPQRVIRPPEKDAGAPWGRKKDGTPRARPGRPCPK